MVIGLAHLAATGIANRQLGHGEIGGHIPRLPGGVLENIRALARHLRIGLGRDAMAGEASADHGQEILHPDGRIFLDTHQLRTYRDRLDLYRGATPKNQRNNT